MADLTIPPLLSKSEWSKQEFSFEFRHEFVKKASWQIITKEVVAILSTFLADKKTLEVFGGTGLLAQYVKANNPTLDYKSYGLYRCGYTEARYPELRTKNAFMLPIAIADVILMSWPPYDTNHAYRIARKMKPGQCLIYAGEGEGGCTGDDKFHDYLKTHFELCDDITQQLASEHVKHFGIRDEWWVYRRNSKSN